MILRPYQEAIIEEAQSMMRCGVRKILIEAPTGSGKRILAVHMLKSAALRRKRSWFNVHRRELLMQAANCFTAERVEHGLISAGIAANPHPLVQVCSVQTLKNRHYSFDKPDLIIWDECQHLSAASWARVYASYPHAFHIGLTATPERLDGKGLGKFFTHMIHGPSVRSLIAQGYLSDYKVFAPKTSIDVSGIHTRMGDFYKPALQVAVDKPTITGEALSHYNKLAKGKRTLIFCVSIEHSKNVVRQFQIAGMLAAHVDGDTPYDERDRIMKKFERGEIRVLSNVDLFGEGLDISGIEALLVLRPTQSRSLHRQMIGRCLRTHPGKDYAIIMDAAGNMQRHGLPDEEIIWSLEGRTKQECKAATGPSIRICPKCYACSFRGQEACPYCGELYPIEPRTVEEIEGELEEIKIINRAKRKREEGMAKTMAELVAVGRSRGYRNPYYWAQMKLQGRGRR